MRAEVSLSTDVSLSKGECLQYVEEDRDEDTYENIESKDGLAKEATGGVGMYDKECDIS